MKKSIKIISIIIFLLAVAGMFAYRFLKPAPTNKSAVLMGADIVLTAYAGPLDNFDRLSARVFNAIEILESEISVNRQDTLAARLNQGETIKSARLAEVCRRSVEVCKQSDYAFNPALGGLISLWGIGTPEAGVPEQAEIRWWLGAMNSDPACINIKGDTVYLRRGIQVDFGAVGKGLACDVAKEIIDKSGLPGGVLSVGGSLYLFGSNKGKPWPVDIQDPAGSPGEIMGTFTLSGGFVSTSGSYQRYFETEDGARYHHILNPATGYPANSGLVSVTVAGDDGFLTDALSTACFVLGLEEGLPLLKSYGMEGVFITGEGGVVVTDGLRGAFTLIADNYTMVEL